MVVENSKKEVQKFIEELGNKYMTQIEKPSKKTKKKKKGRKNKSPKSRSPVRKSPKLKKTRTKRRTRKSPPPFLSSKPTRIFAKVIVDQIS